MQLGLFFLIKKSINLVRRLNRGNVIFLVRIFKFTGLFIE